MRWLRRGIADAVEFRLTVNYAVALGADRRTARDSVRRVRQITGWPWARIREAIQGFMLRGIS